MPNPILPTRWSTLSTVSAESTARHVSWGFPIPRGPVKRSVWRPDHSFVRRFSPFVRSNRLNNNLIAFGLFFFNFFRSFQERLIAYNKDAWCRLVGDGYVLHTADRTTCSSCRLLLWCLNQLLAVVKTRKSVTFTFPELLTPKKDFRVVHPKPLDRKYWKNMFFSWIPNENRSVGEIPRIPSDPSSSHPKNNVLFASTLNFSGTKLDSRERKKLTAPFWERHKKLYFKVFGRSILDCHPPVPFQGYKS